jgi:alkylation response protein AidB-like acyl-CoA dehydrogenase
MDVRLSTEQQALRDSVAQVVEKLAPTAVGQLDDLERVDKLDAAVASSGWRELRASEDGGAPLASGVEVAIVAEELGRGLVDAPFLGPTLAAELRRLAGAPSAAADETVLLAPGLIDLARVPDGTPPAGSVAIDARGAGTALALSNDGTTLVEVALLPGRGEPEDDGLDLTRRTGVVDPSIPVALVDQGRPLSADDLVAWTALGLAVTCADLVGTMRGAVELSCEYAAARRQYGAAIGSFQAVQHLLADAFVAMEGSRSITLHAAWAVDALPPDDALAAAAVAKAYCARAARTVCETAIQVHGGIGNTWECMAHVYLRRALLSSDVLGGAGTSLERVLQHRGLGDGHGLR